MTKGTLGGSHMSQERRGTAADRASRRYGLGLAQGGAYVAIVAVALHGFQQTSETQDDLCRIVEINREAVRDVIRAVEELGSGMVRDGKPLERLSAEELGNIELLARFRERQLALLPTDDTCGK